MTPPPIPTAPPAAAPALPSLPPMLQREIQRMLADLECGYEINVIAAGPAQGVVRCAARAAAAAQRDRSGAVFSIWRRDGGVTLRRIA